MCSLIKLGVCCCISCTLNLVKSIIALIVVGSVVTYLLYAFNMFGFQKNVQDLNNVTKNAADSFFVNNTGNFLTNLPSAIPISTALMDIVKENRENNDTNDKVSTDSSAVAELKSEELKSQDDSVTGNWIQKVLKNIKQRVFN